MRDIPTKERIQRGCVYCADMRVSKAKKRTTEYGRRQCPFETCPYTVLDKYETYDDFMASYDSKIDIEPLIQGAGMAGRLSAGAVSAYGRRWLLNASKQGIIY